MKTKKDIKKRNQRIFIFSITLILILLILYNLQDVLQGLQDGARAAGQSF